MQISVLCWNNHNDLLTKLCAVYLSLADLKEVYLSNSYPINKQMFTSDEN